MTQWGLDALFNPGKRHMDDEKRRLQSTREEIGDASGGRRIDLESGTVSISLPGRAGRTDDDSEADDALEPAVEAETEPGLALSGGEATIEPEVADESQLEDAAAADVAAPVEHEVVNEVEAVGAIEEAAREGGVDGDDRAGATSSTKAVADQAEEPAPVSEPDPAPEPAATATPAPSRRSVSANAWARRG